MAIPSGSGTEVLKNSIIQHGGTGESAIITGVANHIYTVISIIAYNDASSAKDLILQIDKQNAGTDYRLMSGPPSEVAAYSTFVWGDRFVMTGTDRLVVTSASGSDFEITCSYIDQDWT